MDDIGGGGGGGGRGHGGGLDRDTDFSFDDGPGQGGGHPHNMMGMGGPPPFRGRRGGGGPWRRKRGGPPRGLFDNGGFQRPGMRPPRFRGGGRRFMGGPMLRGGPMQRGGPGGFPNRGPPMRYRQPMGGRPPFDGGKRHGHFGAEPSRQQIPPQVGSMNPKEQLWAETPTGEGKSYYYHTLTRETTWERPEGPDVRIITHGEWVGSYGGGQNLANQGAASASDDSRLGHHKETESVDLGGRGDQRQGSPHRQRLFPPGTGQESRSGQGPQPNNITGPRSHLQGLDGSFDQDRGEGPWLPEREQLDKVIPQKMEPSPHGRGLPSLLEMPDLQSPLAGRDHGRDALPFHTSPNAVKLGPPGTHPGPKPDKVVRNYEGSAETPILAPLHNLKQATVTLVNPQAPPPGGLMGQPSSKQSSPPSAHQRPAQKDGSLLEGPPNNQLGHPGVPGMPSNPKGGGQNTVPGLRAPDLQGQQGPVNGLGPQLGQIQGQNQSLPQSQGMTQGQQPGQGSMFAQSALMPVQGQAAPRHPGPTGGPAGLPFMGGSTAGQQGYSQFVGTPGYPPFGMGTHGYPPFGMGTHGYPPFGMGPPRPGSYPSNFPMFPPPWGICPVRVPPPMFQPAPVDPFLAQVDPTIVAAAQEWSEYTSPDGNLYYFNSKTQTSTWLKPSAIVDLDNAKYMAHHYHHKMLQQHQMQQQHQPSPQQQNVVNVDRNKKPESDVARMKEIKKTEVKKAVEKCRPISSTPIPGTPWSVVWTPDRRVFFYNPSSKQSVWKRPTELIGRMDVEEWTRTCPDAKGSTKVKRVVATSTSSPLADADKPTAETATCIHGPPGTDLQIIEELTDKEQPPKKKQRWAPSSEARVLGQEPTVVTIADDDSEEGTKDGKSIFKDKSLQQLNPMEAETKAAKERAIIPVEDRLKQFKAMLIEKDVSAFSTWEKELHKIVFDSRYLLLNSKERKQAFDSYVKERAEEERKERRYRIKQNREEFFKFLKELNVTSKMSYSEFSSRHGRDDRCKLIERQRDRETAFLEFQADVRKKEKEERIIKKEASGESFVEMLKENVKDYQAKWVDLKKNLESDARFHEVESEDREEIYSLFQRKLKQDTKALEKAKKREKKDRQNRDREKMALEKEKSAHTSTINSENVGICDDEISECLSTKKDAEATGADESHVSPSEITEDISLTGPFSENRRKRQDEVGCITDDDDDDSDYDEKEEREKKERAELSIRERERQVQCSLAGHLRDRDKEREFHRHQKAIQEFQALLADLIRNVEVTWKEARNSIKKDRRWGGVSILTRDEMEDIFTQHCDMISRKKKQRFQELLVEANVNLNSTWRDVRKKINDDPRFEKFSSSDRKCEREFDLYLKDLSTSIKNDYRELLKETKMLTYKSKLHLNENPAVIKDIESMLSKDKRYLQMDTMADERQRLLLDFIDDLERKGPPPPPTASEPSRRMKS